MAIAAVASARSSLFGRAPTKKDVDLALVLLGYDAAGIDNAAAEALAEQRVRWFAAASHHPAKVNEFVAGLDRAVLELTAEQARARMARGEQLVAH